jgi:hypothetical protein
MNRHHKETAGEGGVAGHSDLRERVNADGF